LGHEQNALINILGRVVSHETDNRHSEIVGRHPERRNLEVVVSEIRISAIDVAHAGLGGGAVSPIDSLGSACPATACNIEEV